ncbi:MAG: shikimate dehydrogenase [Rikenellaceae bacterium]
MRKYGLIGKTLKHSFSANYFAEKFEREGIKDCSYSLFELEKIEDVLSLLKREPDLCGFNITIPYKQQIFPYLDEIDVEAERIGAVNCVKIENGKLKGYNTDIFGLRSSMAKLLDGAFINRALVLGTGGASSAVQYMLGEMGIEFELVSRDPMKSAITYSTISAEDITRAQLIINTTPLGTFPDVESAPQLPYAFVSPSHFLFDLVYNPPLTQFLSYGEQRGARTLNGETMLLAQAEESWRIWRTLQGGENLKITQSSL